MITKEYISEFYKAVDSLGLRFPVATISKATKESKGNVSKYLNRKKDPSEEFIKKFYESFPIVSHETTEQLNDRKGNVADLQEEIFLSGPVKITAQEYVDALKRDKEQLQKIVDLNLQAMQVMLNSLRRHDQAFHETMLRSLARLEKKKPEDLLILEAHTRNAALQVEEEGKGISQEDTSDK